MILNQWVGSNSTIRCNKCEGFIKYRLVCMQHLGKPQLQTKCQECEAKRVYDITRAPDQQSVSKVE